MRMDVDKLTDEQVVEIQKNAWDGSEYEGSTEPMDVAMYQLCENMQGLPITAYRNYLKTCEEQWQALSE